MSVSGMVKQVDLYGYVDGRRINIVQIDDASPSADVSLATTSSHGLVMPDGVTTTVSPDGVISAVSDTHDTFVRYASSLNGIDVESMPEGGIVLVEEGAESGSGESSEGTGGGGGGVDVVGPVSRHGERLKDADGNIVAVVCGSYLSGGVEPWNIFGERKWLAVAIAQYRAAKTFGWYDVNIPSLSSNVPYVNKTLAVNNTSEDGTGNAVSCVSTEAHMDAFIPNDKNQDSKIKTDFLLQNGYPENYPPNAALLCRSIVPVIDGSSIPMDLPRISVLMRIYQARSIIDELDTSPYWYSPYRLGQDTWGFSGTLSWSSTVYNYSNSTKTYFYSYYMTSTGGCAYTYRNNTYGVIPALEIPA